MDEPTGDRLLIVEDDLATLFALRTTFARAGWDISSSRTLAHALALLVPTPAWIILDLGLADGDGEGVLRSVREGGINTRIAVLSAALDYERVAGLARWRPDVVMAKPIAFAKLLEAIGEPAQARPEFTLAGPIQNRNDFACTTTDRSRLPYRSNRLTNMPTPDPIIAAAS